MKLQSMLPFRTALAGIMMVNMAAAQDPSGITQEYCSNQNTGSDFSPVYSIYQSMGSCSKTCRDQYAFAVVQGKNCWCSNYIPKQQSDVYDCSSDCPGYPGDWCGNPGQGMYGYIALDKQPSGTAGASSQQPQSTRAPRSSNPAPPPSSSPSPPPSSSPSPPPSSSPSPSPSSRSPPPPPSSTPEPETSVVSIYSTVTSVKTKKPDTVTSLVTPTPPSSSSPPPPPASSSGDAPSSDAATSSSTPPSTSPTRSPTPVIRTQVITRSGSVVTQTVTTTPVVISGGDGQEAQAQMKRRSGLSAGAIAGIVIGTLLGLAALALAGFLLYRRRKKPDAESNPSKPKRTTSVLSRTGLLSRGRPPSMAENHDEPDPWAAGAASVRHSMMFGAGASVEPSSPLGGSQDHVPSSPARRGSRPMVYDQRLNPSALFANPELNGSRVSMQDQQDYSRPLGIANPDFRGSFDSRVSR